MRESISCSVCQKDLIYGILGFIAVFFIKTLTHQNKLNPLISFKLYFSNIRFSIILPYMSASPNLSVLFCLEVVAV